MAKTKNILLKNASGKLGDQLVIKQYRFGTVISKYPDMSGVKYNARQKKEQGRFRKAVAYAQSIIRNPSTKAAWKRKLPKGASVYHAAIREYLKKK